MKVLALALTVAFATHLYAQSVAPELDPLAAKYKADRAAYDAQKTANITRVQQPYLSSLDGAERTATSVGSLDTVAAITREREAIRDGKMSATFPAGLPNTLQAPRKACLDSMKRVDADLAPRQKAIDADYLRALSALERRTVGKPELFEQIAVEKAKLIANVDVAGQMEALLTSKEWVHRGQFHYKFFKGGKYQQGDRKGRYEIDAKEATVSFFWEKKDHPGEGLVFNKLNQTFVHNDGGEFAPVKK